MARWSGSTLVMIATRVGYWRKDASDSSASMTKASPVPIAELTLVVASFPPMT